MQPSERGENMAKPEYWQMRLRRAVKPIYAIGVGFDWDIINKEHRRIIGDHIKSDDTVLDIGCGIGRTAEWFTSKQYLGIDFVPEFIDIAKKQHPNHKFRVWDAREKLEGKWDWGLMISVKGVMDKSKQVLEQNCKKFLILEYTNPEEFIIN